MGTNLYVNRLLPVHGFVAMQFFGFILVRKEYEYTLTNNKYRKIICKTINHENIHTEQIKDFGIIFKFFPALQILFGGLVFYLIYVLEWLIHLLINKPKEAYRNISFEKEAHDHEEDFNYVENRKHFQQWRKDNI